MIIKANQLSSLISKHSAIKPGVTQTASELSAPAKAAKASSVSQPATITQTPKTTLTHNLMIGRADMNDEDAKYQVWEKSFYDSSAYDQQYNGKSDEELLRAAANYLFYFSQRVSEADIGYNEAQSQYYNEMSAYMESKATPMDSSYKNSLVVTKDGVSYKGTADVVFKGIVSKELQYDSVTRAVFYGLMNGVISEKEILFSLDRAFDPTLDEPFSVRMPSASGNTSRIFTDSPLFIDRQIENAAAHYAFYANKAAECYQGEAYDEAMKLIDATFDKALNNQIDRFIGEGKYLQADLEGVRDSIKTIFDERKEVYTSIMQSDAFSLGVEGTENEWAAQSSYFTAAKLRQYADGNHMSASDETATEAKYTTNDLKAMAIFNNQMMTPNLCGRSEEEQGMYLGLEGLKMEMLIGNAGMSEAGKAMLRDSFNIYIDRMIDTFNQHLQTQKENKYSAANYLYDSVNESALHSAIRKMVDAAKSDNLELAIKNSIQSLQNLFSAKQQSQYEQGKVQERYHYYSVNSDVSMMPPIPGLNFNMDLARANSFNLLASYLGIDDRISASLFTGLDVTL